MTGVLLLLLGYASGAEETLLVTWAFYEINQAKKFQ
jgi:hypothetical protein